MRFVHSEHPGRGVRLAYCLNLHPADDLEGLLEGLRTTTLPLRERVGGGQAFFGVGPWLPAALSLELTADAGVRGLDRLAEFCGEHRLDAFTYNAFPYGGFHLPGLKEGVFRPTWKAAERLAFTLSVAQLALCLREVSDAPAPGGHLSISTHCGGHSRDVGPDDLDEIAENLALAALNLSQLEDETGHRVVLSLEPEPRSSANDTRALTGLYERVLVRAHEVIGRGHSSLREVSEDIVRAHLGTCLDACHAAVEFEDPDEALRLATSGGAPLGKLQFSSALLLEDPDANAAGRERLLALDEPVYLHQVTGRRGDDRPRAGDLAELAHAWEAGDPAWRGCDQWRCHFHVPVDLGDLGQEAPGLGTTRDQADRLLAAALAAPERWGSRELHVEIETYTWSVLDPAFRGTGALVDGLEREYAHVLARLEAAGWRPAAR